MKRQTVLQAIVAVCAIFYVFGFAQSVNANTHYVDLNSTNPVSPFLSWNTAATNIQDAVDIATNGSTVLVTNGIYETGARVTPGHVCANRVVITNDITVRSVNGPNETIIKGAEATGGGNGSNAVRCVYMSAGVLSGFTITNGHTRTSGDYNYDQSGGGVNMQGGIGVVTNCTLAGNSARYGGGGSYYGTLNNCMLSENYVELYGGGSCYGTLNNCSLSGNLAKYGGGSYYATLNNCTLSDNSAGTSGGGSSFGTLNNCTLFRNSATGSGGGNYHGTLTNCIIYFNTADSSGDNWDSSTISYSCTTPAASGTGNITNNPQFISASHIYVDSPCVGAGSTNYISGSDIDGDPWAVQPSMGCDEPLAPFNGDIDVSMSADYTNILVGDEVTFSSEIHGEVASNCWTFGDGTSFSNSMYGDNVQHSWSTTGNYPVELTAWNDDNPDGVSTSVLVHVGDGNYYVNVNNPSPASPYTSWATAATNIQDAVDQAVGGSTVWVSNGVYKTGISVTPGYACANRVVITNDITLRSVNGPEVTIIKGSEATGGGNGDDAVRCVYMSAGVLSGFAITNGHTRTSDDVDYDQSGGGVNMYGGSGMVTNCTLTGNSAGTHGGGGYDGTLNNCTLSGNSASSSGGGSSDGTLNNCTISGNSAIYGGGNYHGTLNNCILSYNSASGSGGGSYGGTLNNCTLSGNSTSSSGGGSYYGTLNNCTLSDNSAGTYGGGSCFGTLNNCTLFRNSVTGSGGGNYHGTLHNCIIYFNTADSSGDNWDGSTISYSCTTPAASGTGNITSNPQLISASHIYVDSPCVDAGSTNYISGSDLDGDPWDAQPSMGCDEPLAPFNGNIDVSISADYTNIIVGYKLDLPADIYGEVASNLWTFGDGTSFSNSMYGVNVQHSWSTTGNYTVELTAWNDDNPDGVSATVLVHVVDANYYVNVNNLSPASSYTSWATAATNIQDAVNEVPAVVGGSITVWVTNGVYDTGSSVTPGYACANRVVITKDITVRSVNGPEVTIIKGSEATGGGNGDDAVRCVYMSAGVLSGFTITNGHTRTSDSLDYDKSGGGINMYSGSGMVTNCTLSGNSAGTYGGGGYGGTLNNCTFTGNSAGSGGGGSDATLNNCTLTGNSAGAGGGSSYGTLNNCTLSDNSAINDGGGSSGGTLNSCTLSDNSAGTEGGGSLFGTLNNCTLSGNSAIYGGGNGEGTLNNCTLSGNSASSSGGGSYYGTLNNCIIYFNTAVTLGDNWDNSTISDSCTTPAPSGTGNITSNPNFVNVAGSNFHLKTSSPCIDVGDNAEASGSTDLDGLPRISNGLVDMGAYEWANSDNDDMPDWWELMYSGNPTNMVASEDADGDGQNNGEEYITGMNATNADSYFYVNSVSNSQANGFVISWESVAGRLYGVYWTTNLTTIFTPIETNIVYPQNSYTDTLHQADDDAFYKLNVQFE